MPGSSSTSRNTRSSRHGFEPKPSSRAESESDWEKDSRNSWNDSDFCPTDLEEEEEEEEETDEEEEDEGEEEDELSEDSI